MKTELKLSARPTACENSTNQTLSVDDVISVIWMEESEGNLAQSEENRVS